MKSQRSFRLTECCGAERQERPLTGKRPADLRTKAKGSGASAHEACDFLKRLSLPHRQRAYFLHPDGAYRMRTYVRAGGPLSRGRP